MAFFNKRITDALRRFKNRFKKQKPPVYTNLFVDGEQTVAAAADTDGRSDKGASDQSAATAESAQSSNHQPATQSTSTESDSSEYTQQQHVSEETDGYYTYSTESSLDLDSTYSDDLTASDLSETIGDRVTSPLLTPEERQALEEKIAQAPDKPNRRKLDVRDAVRRGVEKFVSQDQALRDFIDNPNLLTTTVQATSGEQYTFMRMGHSIYCVEKIGAGAFGTIYRISFDSKGLLMSPLDPDSEICKNVVKSATGTAMKVVKDDPSFKSETDLIAKRGGLHKRGKFGDKQYMTMDLFAGDVDSLVKDNNLKPLSIWGLYRTMLMMAYETHNFYYDQQVIHRDIKPANFLVSDSGQVKINDFGMSQKEPSGQYVTSALQGTPNYLPVIPMYDGNQLRGFAPINPKAFRNKHGQYVYNETTDGYALAKSFEVMIRTFQERGQSNQYLDRFREQLQYDLKSFPYNCKIREVMGSLYAVYKRELTSTFILEEHLFRLWMKDDLNENSLQSFEDEVIGFLDIQDKNIREDINKAIARFVKDPKARLKLIPQNKLNQWIKYMPLEIDIQGLTRNISEFKSSRAIGYLQDALHKQIDKIKSLQLDAGAELKLINDVKHRYQKVAYGLAEKQLLTSLQAPDAKSFDDGVKKALALLTVYGKIKNQNMAYFDEKMVDSFFRQAKRMPNVDMNRVRDIAYKLDDYCKTHGYHTMKQDVESKFRVNLGGRASP